MPCSRAGSRRGTSRSQRRTVSSAIPATSTTAAPTPGGLGAAELAIVAALALIGKSGEIAIAAALLDRLISYWSLILFGFVLYFAWDARSTVPAPTVPHHARRD